MRLQILLIVLIVLGLSCSRYYVKAKDGKVRIIQVDQKSDSILTRIYGLCHDEEGQPIGDAVFMLANTKNASLTNGQGLFSGRFYPGKRKVIVSTIGFKTLKFEINFSGKDSVKLDLTLIRASSFIH